ncbi:DUF3558 domain-containing protein [Amycolatopsis sp. Hca4]|uniref:DUF3558 domain-containing protein n=1 Tax=Amycolatopsis sp. Hca4 TaxID=2742131 RepID=UPI0015906074|nr:DUF3558 domain-containing protein [Amycolatopsis sp. Hca4]QKV72456.1 DUF3558 domain-containing protein [Amycolatopsis sp. Hca4]
MRTPVIVCATLLAASLLAGCGPSKPQRLLSRPPSPAQTGARLPLDQVDAPVDLAKFDSDPCSLLTKEQAAAVVADPPNGIRASGVDQLPGFGCAWSSPPGALWVATKPIQGPRTLTELSTSPLKKSRALEPWTETSIGGLPAVVHHQFGITEECLVSVEVTAKQMLTFEIDGKDLPGSYWDTDRCGGVAKMAEFVLGNLR